MNWLNIPEVSGCGLLMLEPKFDERGYFMETWNRQKYAADIDILLPFNFAQDNVSFSKKGVLRGFHIQSNNPQGKLVTVLDGKILDVCFDARRTSSTFGKCTRVMLDGENPQSFWLPPGTAHAFLALEDSVVHYKCSTPYDAESDGGFNAYSPDLSMLWPPGRYLQSEKDRKLPPVMDYLKGLK